jgi:hypothetical protein
MEREYIIAFAIIIAVILVIGTISIFGFSKSIDLVKTTSKEIIGYGKTDTKKAEAQGAVQSLVNSLSNCQKNVGNVECTCSIDNKKSLPQNYRIFFQLQKDGKGAEDLLIFAFDNEDKIVQVKAETEALKLKGLKIGMAYWGYCNDCNDGSSSSKYNLYCIFNSEATKNAPIVLKGDSDNDWAFPFYKTQGVPFDQLAQDSKWKDYRNIGNILRLNNNQFCFMTTNIIRPLDTKDFSPIPLKKSDDIQLLFKGFDMVMGVNVGTGSPALQDNHLQQMAKLKSQFQSCISSFDITSWRALKEDPLMQSKEAVENLRVLDWPIKSNNLKIVCNKNTEKKYWLDHIEAPIGTQVNSPTDMGVFEVGSNYVILTDKIDSYSTNVNDPSSITSITQETSQSYNIPHEISRVIYLGNLKEIIVKKGSRIKLGEKIGALSSTKLDYYSYFVDSKSTTGIENMYNLLKSNLASTGIRIEEPIPQIKDKFLHSVRLQPLAQLHLGSTKLLPQQYIGCDDSSTTENELDAAIILTKELDSMYNKDNFDYGSPVWNELQKSQSVKYTALKL